VLVPMVNRIRTWGKFRCVECDKLFLSQPGAHDDAHCPYCGSLYYEWIDYAVFDLYKKRRREPA
jgi:rRNA maturation endonuclease Nob1